MIVANLKDITVQHLVETLNGVTNNSRTAYITAEENTDQIDFYAPDDNDQVTPKMIINKDGVEILGSFINSGSIDIGNELGIGTTEPKVFYI